jgi:FdhD protein
MDKVPVIRITDEGVSKTEDKIVEEFSLAIIFNDHELVRLLCSPKNLDFLTVGFLFSEGLIKTREDIKEINLEEETGTIRVATRESDKSDKGISPKRFIGSSGARGFPFDNNLQYEAGTGSRIRISPHEIFTLMDEFIKCSEIFKETGGVHSAALCNKNSILVFHEDIGRHNAIDKVFGESILKDISTDDLIMITSGRVSSEIVLKAAKKNIPLLVSKSAPTNKGVKLADDFCITLLGFVRGRRMNVYTHNRRMAYNG